MKFSLKDLLLATLTFVSILFLSLLCTTFIVSFCPLPSEFSGIGKIIIFMACLFAGSIGLLRLIGVIYPLKEGVFSLDEDRRGTIWKLQGFLYIFNLGLLMNTYLMPINLRGFVYSLLGAKIGRSVMVGGKILEPYLVEIGDYTQLGEDTLVIAHTVERGVVTLGPIKIGNNVTIGVKTVIMPGVEIGDNAIVGAISIVTKNTKILPGETWIGAPAKKIRN